MQKYSVQNHTIILVNRKNLAEYNGRKTYFVL